MARLPLPDTPLPPTEELLAAMGTDKKREGAGLVFVTLGALGRAELARGVPAALVREAWAWARRARTGEAPPLDR